MDNVERVGRWHRVVDPADVARAAGAAWNALRPIALTG